MTNRQQYDWTWAHGSVAGPVLALFGTVAVTTVGWAVTRQGGTFPGFAPALVGAVAAFFSVLAGRKRWTATETVVFRSACWLLAGGFSTFTLYVGIRWWSFLAFAVVTVAEFILATGYGPAEIAEPTPEQLARGESFEQKMSRLITELSAGVKFPPSVETEEQWPHRTGYTFHVEFAIGTRHGWWDLVNIQSELAAALRLPPGCPVMARPSRRHQGGALLDVSILNDMATAIDYPPDYSPRSIKDTFPAGLLANKTEALIEVYQSSGLIAGRRGSGKTVLLQGITASALRCVDAVVWHVDLNGGGMSAPWISGYALGLMPEPVLDWVAPSPATALNVARVGAAIAKDRKSFYQSRMIAGDVDVLDVDPGVPEILIIVDEGGEVTGEDADKVALEAAKALRELQRIGRAVCVNVVFSVQRGTGDYVPAQMKKGTALKVCGQVSGEDELAFVFGWKKGLNAEDLTDKGTMFLQRDEGPVTIFKAWRLKPRQIMQIATAVLPLRPKVDPRGRFIGGQLYADRWHHPDVLAWMDGLRAGGDPNANGDTITAAPATPWGNPPPPPGGGGGMGRPVQPIDIDDLPDPVGLVNFGDGLAKLAEITKGIQQQIDAAATTDGETPATRPAMHTGADEVKMLEALFNNSVGDPRTAPPAPPAPADAPADGPPPFTPDIPTDAGRINLPPLDLFVLHQVEISGTAGTRPAVIFEQAKTAGLSNRSKDINESLARLRQMRLAVNRDDVPTRTDFGVWWTPGNVELPGT
jgi:hypothetical protein